MKALGEKQRSDPFLAGDIVLEPPPGVAVLTMTAEQREPEILSKTNYRSPNPLFRSRWLNSMPRTLPKDLIPLNEPFSSSILPVGAQIIGLLYGDDTVITFAGT